MERYRLKNIIILILVLVNCFLLGSLTLRKHAESSARQRREDQLVALFASDGMTLDSNVFTTKSPPKALSMHHSEELEQKVAAFFLGKRLILEKQNSVRIYTSEMGSVLFREDGSFEISLTLTTDAEDICLDFCKTFSYAPPVLLPDETNSGTITTVRLLNQVPVYNATVSFRFKQGILTTVKGTLLPEQSVTVKLQQETLSAFAALTAFQNMRRESGTVVSAVSDLYPCYELQSTSSYPLLLIPTWCIVTDTSKYYVDCLSGLVSPG